LLERIIKASSNPGDIVFDCFMGSGTTQAVAMKLGRKFIGADINLGAIQTTTKRLLGVAAEIGKQLPNKGEPKYTGFTVYNVNNYDVFRNPVEAKDLLVQALELQPLPGGSMYDGEKDEWFYKIMPVNRLATKADLNEIVTGFDYKAAEKAALEDYFRVRSIRATVNYSGRRGIYNVRYSPNIFACRSDVGVVGGRVLSRTHKVIGGMFDSYGKVMYEGWDEAEGGPMNRALSVQNAFAVDARCMQVRPDLRGLYEEIVGKPGEDTLREWEKDPQELRRRSILFCARVRELGYLIVWDPSFITVI
jgi:hypothetical protein